MQKSDFDDFYDVVIMQCIKKVLKEAKQNECKYKGERSKYKIYKYYQDKRDFVKNKYMLQTEDIAIDRHKVAACMMYAILKENPIIVNRLEYRLSEEILLANEYLAFFTAVNILEMYKKHENKLSNADYEIVLPKTYHEHNEGSSDFLSNTCKALNYIKLQGINKFDVFAYSSILFLIEKYTEVTL